MTNEVNYAPVRYGCNGVNVDFSFPWKIFENEDIIVQIQNKEGNISTLAYGVDYTVEFEVMGGNVKLKNVYSEDNIVIISRDVSDYQSKSFSTSPGFQASEIEKSLDRVSCNLQEMGYNIENFKKTYSAEIDSQIETLENVIEENKQEVLLIQERYEDNLNNQIIELKADVDNKVETVASAADKINKLDESIALCQSSAEIASEQAEIAANKANEILNVKDELEAEIDTKANVDLSNLSKVGEKHFLGQHNITNCITEIPQRIKLELADGNLILKAGSVVTIPNGFEADGVTPKFDYVTIENDKTMLSKTTTAAQRMCWVALSAGGYANGVVQWCFSGNTSLMNSTAPNAYSTFYNTEINKMYRGNGTAWEEQQFSLPICLATNDATGAYTSIDQVFNGIGYIGSTIWVDKGVKGLIPNGRNEDGTSKNKEFTLSKVITAEYTYGADYYGFIQSDETLKASQKPYFIYANTLEELPSNGEGYRAYVSETNKYYRYSNGWIGVELFNYADFRTSNSKIATLKQKYSFRAIDYSDSSWISAQAMPSDKYIDLTIGATGATYVAPANGFINVIINSANGYLYVNCFDSNNTYCYSSTESNGTSTTGSRVLCPIRKGHKYQIGYSGTVSQFRFIYAQGEV